MQLTKDYQLISSITLTYGACRTYARYLSQDKASNTTTYQIKQVYWYNSSGGYVAFDYATAILDGTPKVYKSYTKMYAGQTTIQELTRVIEHNTDGSSPTKNIATSWTATFGGSGSTNVDITFPRIDRYAYISDTLESATDESTFYFDYSNPLELTMNCWLEVNPTSTPIATRTNIGSSASGTYTWTLTSVERETIQGALTDSNTGTLRIVIESTLDGVAGTTYKDIPITVINANPTFNVAYKDTNGTTTAITNNNQQIIQNNSTLQINITGATALKEATLDTYSININGAITTGSINSATKDVNIGTLDLSSNTNATITITDSRGNSTTKSLELTILEWQIPTAIITLNRKQNFYTATDITVDANYSSLDNKNTITIGYEAKKTTDAWTGTYLPLQDNITTTFNADNTYTWDVRVKVEDALGTKIYTGLTIGIGQPIWFIDRNKRSVGLNCFPQENNSIEAGGLNLLTINSYSATPIPIGYGLDGTTLVYRKVIHTGQISSATVSVAHNISNLSFVWNMYGIAKTNTEYHTLPRVNTAGLDRQISIKCDATNVYLDAGGNANFNDSYVVIEYEVSS